MPAGSSEHQTGLCVDMHNLPAASKDFANEDAYKWLKENCWKFGFILRYPEDKTEITGISFEPWHYRYVGRYHAQRIYQMNMCLEEYIAYISTGG
ncbi:MAG: M15 family metallopeptidase, partial [Clostridia bacterium]|nr:M15 family metallopeptidase [Clostridia bacterium]